MNKKLFIWPLVLAMMIVVLHNVIPHHHHLTVMIHGHGNENTPCSENHCPDNCILDDINLGPPKGTATTQITYNTVDIQSPAGENELVAPISGATFSFFNHPESLLESSILEDLPPRAPPC